ncbi:MAG TPA: hypothetical protein VF857_01495, partial [Spirochaetota bacterium]
LIQALLFGGIYFLIKRNRRSSIVLGLVVLSHWVLDVISHRPDMPLLSSSGPLLGLGLWNSFWGTIAVETILFVGGMVIYLIVTRSRKKISYLPLAVFIILYAWVFIGWLNAPPPADIRLAYVMSGVGQLVMIAIAYWIDSLRETR